MPSLSDLTAPRQKVKIAEQLVGGDVNSIFIAGAVELDASPQEDHVGDNDVTEFPVEEGANISDHSRPNAQSLTLRAIITGTPFDLLAIAIPPALKARRGKDAWEKLHAWRTQGQRVAVFTSLTRYTDMVIQSISTPRNARNSDGVEMMIRFRQIFTARTKTVDKPVRNENKSRSEVGSKPTQQTNPAQNEKPLGLIRTLGKALGSP